MGRNSVPLKRSSASLRYWRAKLQVLKRPTVWGAVLALGLPLLFLSQYWRNPGQFIRVGEGIDQDLGQDLGEDSLLPDFSDPGAPPAANLPPVATDSTSGPAISDASTYLDIPALTATGDLATGDLETLDGIFQPGLLESLLAMPLPNPGRPGQSPPSVSNPARNSASASRPAQPAQLPSLASAVQDPQGFSFSANPQLISANRVASSNGGSGNPGQALSLSPLQAALDRNADVTSSAASGASVLSQAVFNAANASGTPLGRNNGVATGQALTGSGAANGPASGGISGPVRDPASDPSLRLLGQSYLPRTSPYPGTTGYTLPTVLRPTVPVYPGGADSPSGVSPTGMTASPYMIQPIPGVPAIPQLIPGMQLPQVPASLYGSTPGYGVPGGSAGQVYPNFGTATSPVIPVPPVPFSVPRTPPGRSIGNGEINTFSNP